jgi:hypothetical protein
MIEEIDVFQTIVIMQAGSQVSLKGKCQKQRRHVSLQKIILFNSQKVCFLDKNKTIRGLILIGGI